MVAGSMVGAGGREIEMGVVTPPTDVGKKSGSLSKLDRPG